MIYVAITGVGIALIFAMIASDTLVRIANALERLADTFEEKHK